METKHTKVTLTKFEVETLLLVALNGWCDGEFFVNGDGGDTGYGGMRSEKAYLSARDKLKAGVNIISDSETAKERDELRGVSAKLQLKINSLESKYDSLKQLNSELLEALEVCIIAQGSQERARAFAHAKTIIEKAK